MKEVIITQKDSDGYDEIYCEWFVCPECKNGRIRPTTQFCSNCGVKLKWDENALSDG